MRRSGIRAAIRVSLVFLLCFSVLAQQSDDINPVRPSAPIIWRPYLPVGVAPVRLSNSPLLNSLIKGNILYLTAQDAVALAIENNIDIETNRYDSSGWRLERAQAGGALPGVPTGASLTSSVASGQGVLGSQAAAGIRISGASGGTNGTTNVTVSQVGTVAQTYDPTVQQSDSFGHKSLPQADAVQSVATNLVQGVRIYTGSYQQGFETGGSVNISYNEHYLNESAQTDLLNPSVAPSASIQIQHNLLQGLGVAVNTKDIRVAKANVHISDLNFQTLVERTITNVLGSYYTLAGNYEDLKAKQDALETAQKFVADTRRRVELGAAARLDTTTAENQAAASEQALVNSRTAIRQSELQIKNLISRTGASDPVISNLQIMPLDRVPVPSDLETPTLTFLAGRAMKNRADLEAARENAKVTEISNIATVNGLLPSAIAIASKNNQGTAGAPRIVRGGTANAYVVGGMGTALGQIFRNNFPTESFSTGIQLQAFDRVAEADYAIDQLSLRQQQLQVTKTENQAQVDIANSLVAMGQARSRYESAVQSRILQQQLYDAEQKKYAAGESTTYNVTQQQRDLVNAQSAELSAQVSWQLAHINMELNTGDTLAANHVTMDEAQSGHAASRK